MGLCVRNGVLMEGVSLASHTLRAKKMAEGSGDCIIIAIRDRLL